MSDKSKSDSSKGDKITETELPIICIEGPDSPYVKLISNDDHEFYIKREHALISGTIKAMLRSHVLNRVCHYFAYKAKYTNTAAEIPEFTIDPEVALELFMAANFLDC